MEIEVPRARLSPPTASRSLAALFGGAGHRLDEGARRNLHLHEEFTHAHVNLGFAMKIPPDPPT
jgi:hypothetical protein